MDDRKKTSDLRQLVIEGVDNTIKEAATVGDTQA
jgi:hypothetical protein